MSVQFPPRNTVLNGNPVALKFAKEMAKDNFKTPEKPKANPVVDGLNSPFSFSINA